MANQFINILCDDLKLFAAIPCVTEITHYLKQVKLDCQAFADLADHATPKHQSRFANLHIIINLSI